MTAVNEAKKLKVLLIEDDATVRIVHSSFLKKLGYDVEIACHGKDAIDRIEMHFDLILVDMGLPDILGTDVVKEFREKAKNGKIIPIIALTGFSTESSKHDFLASGINRVLIKPVFLEELGEILRQYHP
jgi:CheY-like chemotaxis protein